MPRPLLALCTLPLLAWGQQAPRHLKQELDSIYRIDQLYRAARFRNQPRLVDSLAAVHHFSLAEAPQRLKELMLQADSSNMRRVRAIIQRYGYPGKTLVGEPTNRVGWYVIQHSSSIASYLPLIKQVTDQGELSFPHYAQMLDRLLMETGKPQVYGTQGFSYQGPAQFIWPIEDAAHVNERRKKAGFGTSVEQSAQQMHIEYRPLTLQDLPSLPGYHPPTD